MAGAPDVKVRITGDAAGAKAAVDEAGGALGGLGKLAIPGVAAAVTAVGAAIAAFAKGAVDEAAKAETGMARLGQAVHNAGGNFATMSPEIEKAVSRVQAFSTATDDELRAALTTMITVSGDAKGSMKNLGLAADVAAYSGKSLEESAVLVGKAMSGNTKVLGEFGNGVKLAKDPMEALRQTVGGFAEKQANTFSGALTRINNQWGEFQEAVGNAILSGGGASEMASGLASVLGGLVQWVQNNEGAFLAVRDAVGAAASQLFGIAKVVYETVQPALGPVLKVVFGSLLVLLNSATFAVRVLQAGFLSMSGNAIASLGTLVEKGGSLLKVFGVQVVSETGASLRQYGESLSASASRSVAEAKETFGKGMTALFVERRASHAKIEKAEKDHDDTVTDIHARGAQERLSKSEMAQQIHLEQMRQANAILESVGKKLQLMPQEAAIEWHEVDLQIQHGVEKLHLSAEVQKQLVAGTKTLKEKQDDYNKGLEQAHQKFVSNVESAGSLGLSMIGVAQSAGVLDQKMASTLTSLVNMGVSLAKFGFGSPEGLLSLINGLAQLIGGWGSSAAEQARKDAHMKNTRAIEELTRDLSDYNGSTSGRTFSGVTEALSAVLDKEDINKQDPITRTRRALEIEKALAAAGVSQKDVDKLAQQYGIDLKDPKGLFLLLQILKTRKYGSGTGNFTDELASIEDSFSTLGIEDADDQFAQFAQFAKKHIPALGAVLDGADTASTEGRTRVADALKRLYKDSIAGNLSAREYGNASPAQFRKVIAALLGMLGKADGVLTAPSATTGSVVGAGASVASAFASSVGVPSGGVGAPSLLLPSLGGGGATLTGLDVGGASIGTNIQGNVYNQFYLTQTDGEPQSVFVQRLADAVSANLGAKYARQRDALGLTA